MSKYIHCHKKVNLHVFARKTIYLLFVKFKFFKKIFSKKFKLILTLNFHLCIEPSKASIGSLLTPISILQQASSPPSPPRTGKSLSNQLPTATLSGISLDAPNNSASSNTAILKSSGGTLPSSQHLYNSTSHNNNNQSTQF